MKRGLFRRIAATLILAAFFCAIIPASFAKMSDFSGITDAHVSGISNNRGDADRIRVGSDGDDIVITSSVGEELYRVQNALPMLPYSERRLIESGFEASAAELEKLLEAYTS